MHVRNNFPLFLIFFCGQLLAQSPSATEKKVLESEITRFQAMTNCDTALLRNMLDPELIYLHSNGVQESRQQHLSAISKGTIVYQSMVREPNPAIRRYGKMALVNGRVRVEGLFRGNSFSVLLLYTAVYRKRNRLWRLVNWQSTKVDLE